MNTESPSLPTPPAGAAATCSINGCVFAPSTPSGGILIAPACNGFKAMPSCEVASDLPFVIWTLLERDVPSTWKSFCSGDRSGVSIGPLAWMFSVTVSPRLMWLRSRNACTLAACASGASNSSTRIHP